MKSGAFAGILAAGCVGAEAEAAGRRPPFEASDLGLASPGGFAAEVEAGMGRASGGWVVHALDFELDAGLHERLELGVGGSLLFSTPDARLSDALTFSPDHLWVSLKLGIHTIRDAAGAPLFTAPGAVVGYGTSL
jgi:hypothetical protein